MTRRRLFGVLVTAGTLVLPAATDAQSQAATGSPEVDHSRVLARYCVSCHNARSHAANLALDTLDVEQPGTDPQVWEKVVRKLRAESMPPAGRPRPDRATYDALASHLEAALDEAAAARPNPGRPSIHRLNRTEYANTVRDLLALEIDGATYLPADDIDADGFDNNAEVLTISPVLFERYLSAARKIARRTLGHTTSPTIETYELPKLLMHEQRASEALPFGSSGGAAIRHHFPVDGEYQISVRLQRNVYNYIRGLSEPQELDVRLDRKRLATFTFGGVRMETTAEGWAGTLDGSPEWEESARNNDAGFNVRFSAKAGTRTVGVSFIGKTWALDGVLQPRQAGWAGENDERYDGYPGVRTIAIEGPYDIAGPGVSETRERLLLCQPATRADEAACARTILTTLARRAYRRPVSDADVETLMALFRSRRAEGSFEDGIRLALERVLVSPDFLFQLERDPVDIQPDTPYRLTDVELASRLAAFLWSSIPDDELLGLAETDLLADDPRALERQVRRMLADPRSSTLVSNFASQWLQLRNIREHAPDPELFPDFDDNLRDGFERETVLFIENQMRENRSVVELLSANHSYLNERLARHYGISGVYGNHFRRVSLDGSPRGGLLSHGSLLTVTSYPNRTSPVLRGKWLLETFLNAPPPPPPPNVPALPARSATGRATSVRERLEAHRANPVCAACHSQLDPMGFALENFDAIGAWRTIDDGTPIDPSGTLPGGTAFDGLTGLRDLLVGDRREQFVRALTEKLLGYGLGRSLEYYDAPVVRQIVRDAAEDGYTWSSIVLGIVKSPPFQMRRSES